MENLTTSCVPSSPKKRVAKQFNYYFEGKFHAFFPKITHLDTFFISSDDGDDVTANTSENFDAKELN